ncbi:MAG: hypothetical protein JNL73_19600 [Anaerolineales bacterium]|nr:hypothetical protein [Anaerolineales bacterium]
MNDRRALLSTLWIFASLNYLYCDLIGMMDPAFLKQLLTGVVGSIEFTPAFLLGASVLMQIPMGMVLLSRVLGAGANRWANVLAGTIMTLVQIGSLTLGAPAGHYVFFSAFEITCTIAIAWLAWTWRATAPVAAAVPQLAR